MDRFGKEFFQLLVPREEMTSKLPIYHDLSNPDQADATNETRYLPVEYFRDGLLMTKLLRATSSKKRFLSSGTTDLNRSQSHFSLDGLKRYEEGSTKAFFDLLGRLIPSPYPPLTPQKPSPPTPPSPPVPWCQGFSLIPTPEAWPDSSLAQMVAWIHEKGPARGCPVVYVTQEGLAEAVSQFAKNFPEVPCWIFGTAFHYVQLIDGGMPPLKLPAGSLVFDTGGTKGQSRQVSRPQLISMLCEHFHILESQIVSEYGMSELACQAYDGDQRATSTVHGTGKLRFPPEVGLSVMVKPGLSQSSGRGLLVISDPARVDYPWPIRTEDLVDLEPSGAFTLLGRAPKAPLKGCSLKVESITQHPIVSNPSSAGAPTQNIHARAAALSIEERLDCLLAFVAELDSSGYLAALEDEFSSATLAKLAWQDLWEAFPQGQGARQKLLDASFTAQEGLSREKSREAFASPQRWLMLLPENHSIVAVYPLLMAYLCGLKVTVRVPKAFAQAKSFLQRWIKDCRERLAGFDLAVVDAEFRLTPSLSLNSLPFGGVDRILVYGSDETVSTMTRWFPGQVHGFGHSWSMSLVSASELGLNSPTNGEAFPTQLHRDLLRDTFALGQMGCRSSRLVVLAGGQAQPAKGSVRGWPSLFARLGLGAGGFWGFGDMASDPRLPGLEFEACRLRRLGFATEFNECLVGWRAIEKGNLSQIKLQLDSLALEPMAAEAAGTLSVLVWPFDLDSAQGNSLLTQLLTSEPNLSQVTLSKESRSKISQPAGLKAQKERPAPLSWLDLGTGNRQIWDGLHLGHSLFKSN